MTDAAPPHSRVSTSLVDWSTVTCDPATWPDAALIAADDQRTLLDVEVHARAWGIAALLAWAARAAGLPEGFDVQCQTDSSCMAIPILRPDPASMWRVVALFSRYRDEHAVKLVVCHILAAESTCAEAWIDTDDSRTSEAIVPLARLCAALVDAYAVGGRLAMSASPAFLASTLRAEQARTTPYESRDAHVEVVARALLSTTDTSPGVTGAGIIDAGAVDARWRALAAPARADFMRRADGIVDALDLTLP